MAFLVLVNQAEFYNINILTTSVRVFAGLGPVPIGFTQRPSQSSSETTQARDEDSGSTQKHFAHS